MNHFKQYLEDLGILEEFILVATKEEDFLKYRWENRVDYSDEVSVHDILYYSKASRISKIAWDSVFQSYRFSRVPQCELLDIMGGIKINRPSLFRHRIKN